MRLNTVLAGLLTATHCQAALQEQHPLQAPPNLKQPENRKPNFIFIITDDQDLQLNSVDYTPLIAKHIRDKGTHFANHFVTTAVCCPSRVSLWTGRQAHNTNVTDVNPPHGGYPKFVAQGFNDNFLPVWLQDAGYNTYYTGKLFNAHTVENYHSPHVNGFTGSDFLLDPYTYSYLNATYQRNRKQPVSYEGRHTTDVLAEKALGFLKDGLAGDKPFFLGVAPIAPHANVDARAIATGKLAFTAPVPAERHQHLFEGARVPRTPSFNPDKPSGVSWIHSLKKQNETVLEYNDSFYRSRLRALQGVDELVDALVTRLEESDQLDNTYIIYTADNGYHIGQHRLPPGKTCGFEEDIRVPFFVRGPGVAQGVIQHAVSTHIDVAPTIFELAGIDQRRDFDGGQIPLHRDVVAKRHEHVTVEFWGFAAAEGDFAYLGPGGSMLIPNNTYKAVRLIGDGYSLYYSVWCSNEHELYNLQDDPYQLHNLYSLASSTKYQLLGVQLSKVVKRLDALLLVLKSCQGRTCIDPWSVLHPHNEVKGLQDAVAPKFDDFYESQPQVSFDWCDSGYIIDAEGPQKPSLERYGLPWDTWT